MTDGEVKRIVDAIPGTYPREQEAQGQFLAYWPGTVRQMRATALIPAVFQACRIAHEQQLQQQLPEHVCVTVIDLVSGTSESAIV